MTSLGDWKGRIRLLLKHPLIRTLVSLRGNPRVCVYTEPMWGVSLNMVIPYMSVFMLANGLNDIEVGTVASIYMASQMVFAFLSGALTDKLGRKTATVAFDMLSWFVPGVVWIFAADFKIFAVAALLNGVMKVSVNSWRCLLIEDADKSQITQIYTWIMISCQMSALFAPVAAVLISRLTLVPAVRILLAYSVIVFLAKTLLIYSFSKETSVGIVRMRETRGQNCLSLIKGYFGVLKLMKKSRGLAFSITIASLYAIIAMINTTFWQVIVSKKLGVPDASLPIFTMLRSLIALVFFFTIISRVSQLRLKNPLLIGFASYFAGQAVLILTPQEGTTRYVALILSLIFDGFGAGMLGMLSESMIAINADDTERARVIAIYEMIVMAVCAPFGWIGGILSDMSKDLPFVLNLSLIGVGVAVTIIYYRAKPHYVPQADM